MGLSAALVDRARKYEKARTGRKVEGTTQFVQTGTGPVFRCRLDLPGSAKNTGAGGEPANSVAVVGQLLVGAKDMDGNSLSFAAGDEIEIISTELGRARWQVWNDPQPLRKKRRVIGWQMPVHRFSQPTIPLDRHIDRVRSVSDRMWITDEGVSLQVDRPVKLTLADTGMTVSDDA